MEDEKRKTIIESEMLESAFEFWFNNHEHIRSPFPPYIRGRLREEAIDKFTEWTSKLTEAVKDEVNDEIIAEKFEEILFETAAEIVVTEDEKLTILYPFMPRLGDVLKDKNEESKVVDRTHLKRGDSSFLKVKLEAVNSEKIWETEFELPE